MSEQKTQKTKTIINRGPAPFHIVVSGKDISVAPGAGVKVTESEAKELMNYRCMVDADTIVAPTDVEAELRAENDALKKELEALKKVPAPK